jgi:hypothetical protein
MLDWGALNSMLALTPNGINWLVALFVIMGCAGCRVRLVESVRPGEEKAQLLSLHKTCLSFGIVAFPPRAPSTSRISRPISAE